MYGPDGSKPFDDLVVKKSDPLWAKEFYETNKEEVLFFSTLNLRRDRGGTFHSPPIFSKPMLAGNLGGGCQVERVAI